MLAFTIGHGTRSLAELVATLVEADVGTLVDVGAFRPRRNPQFNGPTLAEGLASAGIAYLHEVEPAAAGAASRTRTGSRASASPPFEATRRG